MAFSDYINSATAWANNQYYNTGGSHMSTYRDRRNQLQQQQQHYQDLLNAAADSKRYLDRKWQEYQVLDQKIDLLGKLNKDININYQDSFTTSINNDNFLQKNIINIENPFRFSDSIFSEVNKYKFLFTNTITEVMGRYKEDGKDKTTVYNEVIDMAGAPSLFNPYFSVHIKGMAENTPLLNYNFKDEPQNFSIDIYKILEEGMPNTNNPLVINFSNTFKDFSDCTIANLVKLSKTKEGLKQIGGGGYRYADFMFCKDLGKISNNHLITLRRFQHPVGDNIWDNMVYGNGNNAPINAPDIGRLVTWFNEDNKLEDIINYSFHATWKDVSSKIQSEPSQEDTPERGIMGSIVNMMDPNYANMVKSGKAGSGNKILNAMSSSINTNIGNITDTKGQYEGHAVLGNYDNNRVYTPQNTVWDTNLYEGKLVFNQEFKLVFNYELRAYENINPKSAFLDLIANIQEVTFRHGHFWGGEQKIVGYGGNRAGWKKAQNFVDKGFDKIGGFFDSILNGNCDWSAVWGSISDAVGGIFKAAGDTADDIVNNGGKKTKETVKKEAKKANLNSHLKGMIQNKLGRPAVYAFDSLLSGDPVGLWHVTLGNPLNPIMSMGNLIITDTNVQQYGPLGIDDFPTGLKVTVSLKHARGRDATDIAKMYTQGKSNIYMPMTMKKIEKYYNFGNTDLKDAYQTKKVDKNGTTTYMPTSEPILVGEGESGKLDEAGTNILSIFGTNDARQIVFNFANN